jgi:hypothetical protein
MPKNFRVFYSWQSDLPKATNINAIRKALKTAAAAIEKKRPKLKIVIDEATRGVSGSPNIPTTLLRKIEAADMFIGDVTTIRTKKGGRPCPNPNVVYEMGYASAELGWERIVFLFNEAHGVFPADLPFDFAQHRGSPFKLSATTPANARAQLAKFLEIAIMSVIDAHPKRPAELRGVSPEKTKHERDVETMTWLMSAIHLPTLQDHIEVLPHRTDDKALWFWEHVNGVLSSPVFSVYDPILKVNTGKLHQAWARALAYPGRYHETPSGMVHIFSNPGDGPLSVEQQADWDAIDAARREMHEALEAILSRLRESYIEIDLTKTNRAAWTEYVAYRKELEEDLGLKPAKKKAKKGKAKVQK